MISWLRLSVAFFLLILVFSAVAYFFGPDSIKRAVHDHTSPVRQSIDRQ